MGKLSDPAAERAVLAGICRYGADAFLDIVDMVKASTFTIDSNRIIYRCIEKAFHYDAHSYIDIPTILSSAQDIGVAHHFDKKDEAKHLAGVAQMPVEMENVRKFAGKIRKLEIARLIRDQLGEAQENLLDVTGSENILSIISMAEVDFSSLMEDGSNAPDTMGEGLSEYINYLAENPVEQMGISTGFPAFDDAIGGGLRGATINVIAARPKVGKTLLSDNMGFNIATEGIPVLNLDTEMKKEDHMHRMVAMLSGVSIRDIETGKFGGDVKKKNAANEAVKKIEKGPYFYKSIAGMSFEDQLSLMRRWISKEVGLNPDGTAKPCVIIYDYLKLMDSQGISQEMKEFQLLGFMMTTLHNFAHRYNIPFLTFMQLNRDGINKEDTSAASGSDRIIWLCSNFTLFRTKSREEIQEDGVINGNRKLVVLVARHGEGMEMGNYINCEMIGYSASIKEGKTKFEIEAERQDDNEGFIEDTDDGEDIPFE